MDSPEVREESRSAIPEAMTLHYEIVPWQLPGGLASRCSTRGIED